MYDSETQSRILVVEDDIDIQQVLCVYLRCSGFEVCSASDGQEAIRLIQEFSPHFIVLDLIMRPVDGWAVLHWLGANPQTPALPVLVLTALTHVEQQVHGLEAGAVEYMTKPAQPSALVERISTILNLSEEQRAILQRKQRDERRQLLERISAPQPDEFVY